MQKLIKLNDQHYIIVDDSEIKKGWVTNGVECFLRESMPEYSDEYANRYWKNITHSTQPLGTPLLFTNAFESELSLSINGLNETFIENWGCKKLSLSEVEEAINGYSVEKMAKENWDSDKYNEELFENEKEGYFAGYWEGFKAHQELTKDKLFTKKDMINSLKELSYQLFLKKEFSLSDSIEKSSKIIQSLLPKTEWDITFDEQGKIKLIRKQLCVNNFGTSDLEKTVASKSAEITEQVAIEFGNFLFSKGIEYYDDLTNGVNYTVENKEGIFTMKELFQEFLKTKQ